MNTTTVPALDTLQTTDSIMKTSSRPIVPFHRPGLVATDVRRWTPWILQVSASLLRRLRDTPHPPASWAPILLLALLGSVASVSAQQRVPAKLSFQGYIEDANGAPLGDPSPKNYDVLFEIYDDAVDGTLLWSESQSVTFDKGNYSVLLGQIAPESVSQVVIDNATDLYVQTTVTLPNGDSETILPRLQLLPTPYAFLAERAVKATRADDADNADNATNADNADTATRALEADWAIGAFRVDTATNALSLANDLPGSKIVNGTIDETKLEQSLRANLTGIIGDERLPSNLARKTTTNTFTADQRIEGNLTVTNNVKLGVEGQLMAVAGAGSLRMVTGSVGPKVRSASATGGERVVGTGWTAVAWDPVFSYWPNSWVVTFDPPFTQPPMVVCSWHLEGGNSIHTGATVSCGTSAVTTNSVTIYANQAAAGGVPPLGTTVQEFFNVNFIAIGLR